MLQAEYEIIKDERPRMRMAIKGATLNEHFRRVIQVLREAGMPNKIRIIEESMTDEEISMEKEER